MDGMVEPQCFSSVDPVHSVKNYVRYCLLYTTYIFLQFVILTPEDFYKEKEPCKLVK